MGSWSLFKKSVNDFKNQWGIFIAWSVAGAASLRFVAGMSWSFIALCLFALFAALELKGEIVRQWGLIAGEKSIAVPRIWTFHLHLTKTLLQEVSASLSKRYSQHKFDCLGQMTPPGVTPEFLQKVVIEEYRNRVRVHLWLVSDSDSSNSRYDWFDVDMQGKFWRVDNDGGRQLWGYAPEGTKGGALSLSGSWERSPIKKRSYFQLTLWVNHWDVRVLAGPREIQPNDVIFKLPLEPWVLRDNRQLRVHGEVLRGPNEDQEPHCDEEDDWEDKSGEGSGFRWEWFLHMRSFPLQ